MCGLIPGTTVTANAHEWDDVAHCRGDTTDDVAGLRTTHTADGCAMRNWSSSLALLHSWLSLSLSLSYINSWMQRIWWKHGCVYRKAHGNVSNTFPHMLAVLSFSLSLFLYTHITLRPRAGACKQTYFVRDICIWGGCGAKALGGQLTRKRNIRLCVHGFIWWRWLEIIVCKRSHNNFHFWL